MSLSSLLDCFSAAERFFGMMFGAFDVVLRLRAIACRDAATIIFVLEKRHFLSRCVDGHAANAARKTRDVARQHNSKFILHACLGGPVLDMFPMILKCGL